MTGDIIVGATKQAHDWLDYVSFGLTFLGFVALCVYTYFTRCQMKIAAKSLKESLEANRINYELTQRSLILGRRSWIIPDAPRISEDETEVTVKLINYGAIPGVVLRGRIHGMRFAERPAELPAPGEDWGHTRGQMIIAPDQGGKLMTVPTQLAGEGSLLLVSCQIEYTDVFEKTWETLICWWRRDDDDNWFALPQYNRLV